MTPGAAIENIIIIGLPAVIYAVVVRWRAGLSASEIASRLGLSRGTLRALAIALAGSVPGAFIAVWVSSWTKGFEGSTLAPFIEAAPAPGVLAAIITYGLIGTGFPEELIFRGLIGGALFRRLSFWRANVIQTAIFVLPHLLILLVAPELWGLAVCLPLILGLFTGWLRFTSGSIVPGIIVHASGNIAGALAVLNWRGSI